MCAGSVITIIELLLTEGVLDCWGQGTCYSSYCEGVYYNSIYKAHHFPQLHPHHHTLISPSPPHYHIQGIALFHLSILTLTMLFSTLISLISLGALAATVAAVDILAFQGPGGCDDGSHIYFMNVRHDQCIIMPTSFGIRFLNVPPGAKGHTYRNNKCTDFVQEGGSGTYCLSGNGPVISANWFGGLASQPLSEMTTGLQYTAPNGVSRNIRTAGAGALQRAIDLLNHKNFAMLATFPDGMS